MKTDKIKIGDTVLISSGAEYYDDCPVCRAMKKAQNNGRDLTEEEIEEAFKEVNSRN